MKRPRLSYANVMSSLALFVALGGTSYAITKLPENSVGSAQVRDGSLRSRDLASDARVAGPRGPRGTEGPAGPAGAVGPAGATGPSDVIETKATAAKSIPPQAGGTVSLASLTLDAGSWSVEGQTKLIYNPGSPGSEFFDCDLKTSTGTLLDRATARVGTDAIGSMATTLPVRSTGTFDVRTEVVLACTHPSTIAPDPYAEQSVLQATRVGRIQQR